MNTFKQFGDTAKSLAKNPLGIIALFIVLIYGFASLVAGVSSTLQPAERYLIVWFMILFPVLVLAVFGWLVSCHHEKLYSPRDFNSDEAFLKGLDHRGNARPELKELEKKIESQVHDVLAKLQPEIRENGDKIPGSWRKEAAEEITSKIRKTAFITIDARNFTGSNQEIFELPFSAFSTIDELTNEVYFLLESFVDPFEYGYSWVLRKQVDGSVIKTARIITGSPAGAPINDTRHLRELGIEPGMTLEVAKPDDSSPT